MNENDLTKLDLIYSGEQNVTKMEEDEGVALDDDDDDDDKSGRKEQLRQIRKVGRPDFLNFHSTPLQTTMTTPDFFYNNQSENSSLVDSSSASASASDTNSTGELSKNTSNLFF